MEKEKKAKKQKAAAVAFWNPCVKIFFDFVAEKFDGEKPTFDGSSPRDLKAIVLALEKRAVDAGVEWTEEVATNRIRKFLESAFSDPWLNKNFLLSNINRQKDKIFFNIKKQVNGTARIGSIGEKPNPTINPERSFGKL